MKACVVIGALCVLSLVSAVPVHNGMFRLKRMCSVVGSMSYLEKKINDKKKNAFELILGKQFTSLV